MRIRLIPDEQAPYAIARTERLGDHSRVFAGLRLN